MIAFELNLRSRMALQEGEVSHTPIQQELNTQGPFKNDAFQGELNTHDKNDALLKLQAGEELYKVQCQSKSESQQPLLAHRAKPKEDSTYKKNLPAITQTGLWTKEEDEKLKEGKDLYPDNWNKIAAHVKSRNNKQCRERWVNRLDPALQRESWSEAEEKFIQGRVCKMHEESKGKAQIHWVVIAQEIKEKFQTIRSPNDIKNFHKTLLSKNPKRRKLAEKYKQQKSDLPPTIASTQGQNFEVNRDREQMNQNYLPPMSSKELGILFNTTIFDI